MVHPMYEIDSEIKRFPLFGRALETTGSEVEGSVYWTIGEMGVIGLPKSIIQAVDKTIDGTDAEKQAVMIGVLYSMAPASLAADLGDAATTYDAPTAAILEEMSRYDQSSVCSAKMAEVATVLNVCIAQATLPMLAHAPSKPSPGAIAALRKEQEKGEKLLLPNLAAPRLEALYQQTKEDTFAVLAGRAPVAKRDGKPKGPGGLKL